jgi:molybdate-binding protein
MEWQEVAARVARDIAAGRLGEGERLPGVRRLAREAGCSAGTAARAYAALRDAGLLVGSPRSSFAVAAGAAAGAASWDPAVAPGRRSGGALRVAGSGDPALDLLLRAGAGSATLASGPRGSVPGLEQLARGTADAAAVHLLDVAGGTWNEGFARSALPGRPAILVHLWRREQGLVLPRGNPKAIRSVADLAGRRIVWRAPGAGSRLLLERLMLQEGVTPRPELGVEAGSHLAVAIAVASGTADAGLAVRAVAEPLGLDWIPVATEWFELAMPGAARAAAQSLLDVLGGSALQDRLAGLPGYDLAMSGDVRSVA